MEHKYKIVNTKETKKHKITTKGNNITKIKADKINALPANPALNDAGYKETQK